jgi:hypothetical protein
MMTIRSFFIAQSSLPPPTGRDEMGAAKAASDAVV